MAGARSGCSISSTLKLDWEDAPETLSSDFDLKGHIEYRNLIL
jgi:hypothetical protein